MPPARAERMMAFWGTSAGRFISIPAMAVLVALLVACADDKADEPPGGNAKLSVVATTVQIAALTREVGGDAVDLHGLLGPGADPHDFEPTASDLVAIEDARVILRHGMGLDDWLDGTLDAGNSANVVTVTDGVNKIQAENGKPEVADPHVWHDPGNVKIMVRDINRALAEADPANRPMYDANASAYQVKLDETKTEVQQIIDEVPAEKRKMVTDHDSFAYFARAFGLVIVGTIFPVMSAEGQPSARETAALLDTVKREGVQAIFAQESVNSQLASTLASDAGVNVVDDLYGDSLGKSGSGAETVDGMLLANARKIADALK